LDITVDYYIQAAGLGEFPDGVNIKGAVQSITTTIENKVTTQFWRSAENFKVEPKSSHEPSFWAVSQAAPYRRMHIMGDIQFDKGGWGSGGFLANSIIEGQAAVTTGQQWFTRNSEIRSWSGGNWNRVFVGVLGAPEEQWPQRPSTVIKTTPIIREKPFLFIDNDGKYAVKVPALRANSEGVSWKTGIEPGEIIPLENFYIATAEKDSAKTINTALQAGKHILLTPGIYPLEATINVTQANTVILGLGLATLVPQKGDIALATADIEGIKLAGFMVDAGLKNSPTLIQIGDTLSSKDHSQNPTSLSDVFCRVGGPLPGQAESCLTINSNNVIADHLWLWRADHGAGADWNVNKSKNGLIVNGDDVTVYGLFNEHFQEYQTLWNGERGRTYFYQSEIPYDPPNLQSWNDQGAPGFASYKVADHVKGHEAWGLGIYSFFKTEKQINPSGTNDVRLENSIECPEQPGVIFTHIVNFAGLNGGINHVINGQGSSTEVRELTMFERFQGGSDYVDSVND
jgi:hypothetical protein